MARCKWAQKTPKIDGKYAAGPCKIMVWIFTLKPVICNGWKPQCLGRSWYVADRRDTPMNWAQRLQVSQEITFDPSDQDKPDPQ